MSFFFFFEFRNEIEFEELGEAKGGKKEPRIVGLSSPKVCRNSFVFGQSEEIV